MGLSCNHCIPRRIYPVAFGIYNKWVPVSVSPPLPSVTLLIGDVKYIMKERDWDVSACCGGMIKVTLSAMVVPELVLDVAPARGFVLFSDPLTGDVGLVGRSAWV